jgi:hypothetical protein
MSLDILADFCWQLPLSRKLLGFSEPDPRAAVDRLDEYRLVKSRQARTFRAISRGLPGGLPLSA